MAATNEAEIEPILIIDAETGKVIGTESPPPPVSEEIPAPKPAKTWPSQLRPSVIFPKVVGIFGLICFVVFFPVTALFDYLFKALLGTSPGMTQSIKTAFIWKQQPNSNP